MTLALSLFLSLAGAVALGVLPVWIALGLALAAGFAAMAAEGWVAAPPPDCLTTSSAAFAAHGGF